jgi:ABC-type phosphate transport system substrate-binding protein
MKTDTIAKKIIQPLTLFIMLMGFGFNNCWSAKESVEEIAKEIAKESAKESAKVSTVAVVTHPKTPIATLTKDQATNIFLGKSGNFPEGSKAIPIDQAEGEIARTIFYQAVVKKDASQLNAYWARLVFTGKGQPPKTVFDDDEVLEFVSTTPNSLGYISQDAVDDSVKVLFVVDE